MRGARLGQFDRFPVSGEPVSADGTLTPAVLRNRHANTLGHAACTCGVAYLGPRDRVIRTGKRTERSDPLFLPHGLESW